MALSLGYASACMMLHHYEQSPLIISRSSASSQCLRLMKPSYKFVCRAQNQPSMSKDDNEVLQGGLSRPSFIDGTLTDSSSTVAGGTACGANDDSNPFQNLGKSEWPELVGVKADVAVATIEKENPNVKAIVVTPDIVAIDLMYNTGRVRVFVDEKGVVTRVPQIG